MTNIWNHQRSRIWFPHAREGWLGSLIQMERKHYIIRNTLPISSGKALIIDRCWFTSCVHTGLRYAWSAHRYGYRPVETFIVINIPKRELFGAKLSDGGDPTRIRGILKKKLKIKNPFMIRKVRRSLHEESFFRPLRRRTYVHVHIGIEKRRVPSWWEWSETQMGDEWVGNSRDEPNETFLRLTCSWRRVTACSLSSLLMLLWIRIGKKKLNGHKEKMFLINKGMA